MRRPQASFEAQPRNARLLAPRWASAPTKDLAKRNGFPFYAVGVDAYIDPPETPVLWRFSGESVEL